MKKIIYWTLISLFVCVFATSAFFIVRYCVNSAKQEEYYSNIEKISQSSTETPNNSEYILNYGELYRQNSDFTGWIKIEGKKINYPVMQSADNPNFYLNHGFDKKYSVYGCPYISENCDVKKPSDNIVIHGHNMKDGSMFAGLSKFRKKDFWENHKTISFNTLYDSYEYEIVAVFKTVADDDGFKYYQFTDANGEEEFDRYISACKRLALYDTGVSAEYGDKLITLSTCEYSKKDGRLAIVAKRIK